jgi:uncharacterized protein GlcG (DUF336 family)
MIKTFISAILSLSFVSAALAASDAYVNTRTLSTASAIKLASVAEETCRQKGYQVTVAVADRYGNLLALIRDPLAGAHTIGIAQDKAYTAASFQGDTIVLAKQLEFLRGSPRVALVGGGVPVKLGGYMYGAVGVSGAPAQKVSGDIDHSCAMAGINAVKEALEFAE